MENLKKMQECLIGLVEGQIYGNIDKVDAKELGEVVDMIKDLSEAVYYDTITEAMNKQPKENYYAEEMYYNPYENKMRDWGYEEAWRPEPMHSKEWDMKSGKDKGYGVMYMMPKRYDDGRSSWHHEPYEHKELMMRDPREGKSGERRKMYMEGKGNKDKAKQMQELESYMQELASDMTELIQDATPEEKSLIQ